MELNNQLELAKKIATEAHAGQLDKGGKLYINHPLFVSESVHNLDEKIVALLHDVLEDSNFTSDDLLNFGFSKRIVDAVVILTKNKDVSYEQYLVEIKKDNIACEVKIADLKHNSDISRISDPTDMDLARIDKYKIALDFLQR